MSTEILQQYVNQLFVNIYSQVPNDGSLEFIHSGIGLISKINPNTKILDVGCGRNLLKPLFPNLIGVDPVTSQADIKMSIQDYQTTERFDVALCLGSIHFGTEAEIKEIIAKIISLLTPNSKIYWRSPVTKSNPLQFMWNPTKHSTISAEMGYSLVECKMEYIESNGLKKFFRWYAEWERIS